MQVEFGMHRDGPGPDRPSSAIGQVTVGPLGLLAMLESDLGLPPVRAHPAERLMAYRACLAEADHPGRFYHTSFDVDPIHVAQTLMGWRSTWYQAGWQGRFAPDSGGRLRDLSDVEALAAARVPLCVGQRIRRASLALESCRTQIERLVLLDDPGTLPAAWLELIKRLPWSVGDGVGLEARALPGTDLHLVQTTLIELSATDPGRPAARLRLGGDGSVVVVGATSRDVSARLMAETLRAGPFSDTSVILAERDGIIVDNALERTGLPRCGFQHFSPFRAVGQVLKLSLALLWEPINPHLLLQFLLHPLGPLPARFRLELAGAVAAEPGIGGHAWRAAIARIEAAEQAAGRGTDAERKRLHADLDYWFHGLRHPVEPGAPLPVLIERVMRCARWLGAQAGTAGSDGERAMYLSAVAQADTLARALTGLSDQGQGQLDKPVLDRLIGEVAREQPDPTQLTEAGRVAAATHPETITQRWDQVIWWDLSAPPPSPAYPWSAAELATLRRHDVALPPIDQTLRARALGRLRPVCGCTKRLVLVVHHRDGGRHPLWNQLRSTFEGWATLDLDDELMEGSDAGLSHLGVGTRNVPLNPLPAPRRWWQLDGLALPARGQESYSSISKLIYYPHEWVLRYAARLNTGRAEDLADHNRLYGSLAHRLFERFFIEQASWRTLTVAARAMWLEHTLPTLLEQEGAVLLEPGRGVDRASVGATLAHALHALVAHLEEADVIRVVPELSESRAFEGVTLAGSIDLLLTDSHGRDIVMDAKWDSARYYETQLDDNEHLQLAAYAYMHQRDGTWPYPAYYIISTGNVLAPDRSVFPRAIERGRGEPPAEAIARLWARARASYRWRREQLERGAIEVPAPDTAPTLQSEPPAGALRPRESADPFDDFALLTGWGPSS